MVFPGRWCRLAAVGVVVSLLPSLALAQDNGLRASTIAASAAATADWATTYYAVKYFSVREVNPLINKLEREPARMISVGAAIDAGLITAWNVGVGRRNERVAMAGLWAMAAFRTYLAIHNLRNTRKAERRITQPDRASLDASANCAGPVISPACEAPGRTVR
jgi:hypothetical protein